MEFSALFVGIASLLLILLISLSGIWLFAGLGIAGLICAKIFTGTWSILPYISFAHADSFTLTAIPMFVLMGNLMIQTGVAETLYRSATIIFRPLPGCLYHAIIMSCAIFGAISGSAIATTATIGSTAIPELKRRGYDKRITYGLIASMGTLGNLIPPAIGFIVFAEITKVSVGKLFIAGILPGLMIMILTMAYVSSKVLLNPQLAPVAKSISKSRLQTFKEVLGIVPFFLIIIVVLGSMFAGIATPTESAAIGVICAAALAACKRKLTRQAVILAGLNTIVVTSMIMLIIVFTYIISGVYGALDLGQNLMEWCLSGAISPTTTIIAMCVMYVILGFFIEGLPLKVLTLAVVYQVVVEGLGYDGVWLGAINEVIVNIGMITPPVAVTLYVTQGLDPGSKTTDIFIGTIPIMIIMLIVSAILIIWPDVALWLPNLISY